MSRSSLCLAPFKELVRVAKRQVTGCFACSVISVLIFPLCVALSFFTILKQVKKYVKEYFDKAVEKEKQQAGISWRARLRTSACKQAFLTQQLRRLKLTILRQRVRRSRQRHFRGATTEITCPNSGPRPRGRTYMSNTKDRQGTRNPTLALLAISDINTQVSQLRPPDTQPVPRLPIHPPSTPPQPQIPSYRRLPKPLSAP